MKRFLVKCLIFIFLLILTACKKNNHTNDNQIETFHSTDENVKNTSTTNDTGVKLNTVSPTSNTLASAITPTTIPQYELDGLCEQYLALLDKASEVDRLDDFLHYVDVLNDNRREITEGKEWEKQQITHPDKYLTSEEIKRLKKGEFIKIPSTGAYIDFNFDGIQEEFKFAYDPDITRNQEYKVNINGVEETFYAQELYGELYAFSLESEIGNHVYLGVVENGPHGDHRTTTIWTYWEKKPYLLGLVQEAPENIKIETYDDKNVLTLTHYFLIAGTYCPYTAHVSVHYDSSNDASYSLSLEEAKQSFYELNQSCKLKKKMNLYSKKDSNSELISFTEEDILNLDGMILEEDWLCFSVKDKKNHSYKAWARYRNDKDEIFVDGDWVPFNEFISFR